MGAVQGTKSFGAFDGTGATLLLPSLEASLTAALPGQWTGVEIVPRDAGAGASGRTTGENRVCGGGLDPMLPEGYLGTPDKVWLGSQVSRLGVDAVLVVSGNPIIRFFDGKGAKAYVASIGEGFELSLVDKTGDVIAYVQLRDFETEYASGIDSKHFGDATKLGDSLGKLIATGFAATVQGKPFAPPSRPGISGL